MPANAPRFLQVWGEPQPEGIHSRQLPAGKPLCHEQQGWTFPSNPFPVCRAGAGLGTIPASSSVAVQVWAQDRTLSLGCRLCCVFLFLLTFPLVVPVSSEVKGISCHNQLISWTCGAPKILDGDGPAPSGSIWKMHAAIFSSFRK